MTRRGRFALASTVPMLFAVCAAGAEPAKISYYKDIRPIFQMNCQGCHQPARPQGGVVLTGHAELLKPDEMGNRVVVPGKPEASELISSITPQKGKPAKMPKEGSPLADAQV